MFKRFRLSTLFWVMVTFGLSLGWYLDQARLRHSRRIPVHLMRYYRLNEFRLGTEYRLATEQMDYQHRKLWLDRHRRLTGLTAGARMNVMEALNNRSWYSQGFLDWEERRTEFLFAPTR